MAFFKLKDVFAGRYLLEEFVGEGKWVQLWKAKDQLAEEAEVLLKIFMPEQRDPDEGIELFKHEYSRSLQLSHPHLLNVEHFDIAEGHAFLVMPYFNNKTLRSLLDEGVSFSERQVALLMSQIGSALESLHSNEPTILHQEVRPENIMVARPDHFLLAHLYTSVGEGLPTEAEESKVTIYQAPEYHNMFEEQDSSGDIFSLGVTLYEMCTHSSPKELAEGVDRAHQKDIVSLPEQYSSELNELIQACLSQERSRRPGAKELRQRGESFLETEDWSFTEGGEGKGSSVKKLVFFTLAAAVFLLFIISTFWAYRTDSLPFPVEENEKKAASSKQPENLDAMLIATLEDELEQMNEKVEELEAENRLLRGEEVPHSILMRNEEPYEEEEEEQLEEKDEQAYAEEADAPGPEEREVEEEKTVQNNVGRGKEFFSARELEEQLNKLSNPAISQNNREALKERLTDRFADGSIRILEEAEGTQHQYSAGIFLNLLFKVPHSISVKEMKINENEKITEIRLEMQTRD